MIAAVLIYFIGIKAFLLVHLPIILLAGAAGVWLFYVQHQFEDTVWAEDGSWNRHEAALHGSSHYDLPGVLRWFTANIGVHHVHHLSSGIPYYRLRDVLRDHPELDAVGPADAVAELQLHPARAVGRGRAQADLVPRVAPPPGGVGRFPPTLTHPPG